MMRTAYPHLSDTAAARPVVTAMPIAGDFACGKAADVASTRGNDVALARRRLR